MVTTRSGRTTAGATPRQSAKKLRPGPHTKKPRRPAKKCSPVRVDHPPAPPPEPIAKLPIEIFYLIVKLFLSIGDGPASVASAPRPSQLYPLATTCKGFWGCLRPLLFELDVNFITRTSSPRMSPPCGGTKIFLAARAQWLLPDPCSSWINRWEKPLQGALLDPLSLAIVMGDTQMVEIFAKGADALLLSRVWPDSGIGLSYSIRVAMTPLHLAIWIGQYEVARILLQRFAEIDQSTLKWYEPAGLGFASYLGYVKIARLMLEGKKGAVPESPWVARIRSQLVEPRAHSRRQGIIQQRPVCDWDLSVTPPMILASLGLSHIRHPPGGEAIFALLAAQDHHLVTKKYNYVPFDSPQTPLGVALVYSKYLLPFAESYILALVRAGALEPSPLLSSRANQVQSYWIMLSHLLTEKLKWKNRRQFIGKCWDAALEYHGGNGRRRIFEGLGRGHRE
ncbi:hypothetical protein B0T18DRAFT_489443 [Schizothecium vesticola]|uniref:Ankyrin n=1 Tax=Schizothecium vesticola TaxID=314040 RepID=A0AA40K5V8_9PEZI|nr:hypothetical protein B0T18DRAFT_489443 [Schizothecium vesticola]